MDRFNLSFDELERIRSEFGSPCYVIDESAFRERLHNYSTSWKFDRFRTQLYFATKSNPLAALMKIAHLEGYHLDVASEGELRAALLAGAAADDLSLHGNAKDANLLRMSHSLGLGEIVIDSVDELSRWLDLGASETRVILRVNPGVRLAAESTHNKIATGHSGSKFGMDRPDLERCFELLQKTGQSPFGLHVHLGSNFQTSGPKVAGARTLVNVARDFTPWQPQMLNFGGGLGVRYTSETPTTFKDHAIDLYESIISTLYELGWTPILAQEPGRAVIAEAGITLLTVMATKRIGQVDFVSVDGGMYENPRPALYDARYEVLARPRGEPRRVTIVGSHCENDVLYPDIELPGLPGPGDLLQVLTTGAYSSAMASNYNRFLRPPTVLRRIDGSYALIQRRETYDDMFARERIPDNL